MSADMFACIPHAYCVAHTFGMWNFFIMYNVIFDTSELFHIRNDRFIIAHTKHNIVILFSNECTFDINKHGRNKSFTFRTVLSVSSSSNHIRPGMRGCLCFTVSLCHYFCLFIIWCTY